MQLSTALLEDWMRSAYHEATFDIGSSGVECFRLGELLSMDANDAETLENLLLADGETYGLPDLRSALAARYCNHDAESIMVTHGSSEAIFLTMQTLLQPGDEVVVVAPCYQQLRTIAEAIGCRIQEWNLNFEDQFQPDVRVAKTLITERTKMVILNFPHNPTGCSLELSDYDQLIAHIASTGAYLVWDAAFAEMHFDTRLPSPLTVYERAIEFGTLSKAFGLPGLRVGWCIADPAILSRFARLRDYITLFLSPLVEKIACIAVRQADLIIQNRMEQNRRNLQMLSAWMDEHADFVSWVRPSGGVTVFPRLELKLSSDALCRELLVQHSVLLVPGSCFGHPQHVRLGFGGSSHELSTGLKRLSQVLLAKT